MGAQKYLRTHSHYSLNILCGMNGQANAKRSISKQREENINLLKS